MRLMRQGLAPGMDNGDHPGLGTEMLRVGADETDRLGCRLEQDVVDHRLVLQRDGGYGRRDGEDDMEIGHRQQVGLAIGEPSGARERLALWTMPIATAVVGDANQAAVVAPLDMAAERYCAACLDGRHHTALVGREPRALRSTEHDTVAAEDVRHLKHGTHMRGSVGRDHRDGEPIEWAGRAGEQIGRNLCVARG